jgi:hypothetical protein
MKPTCRSVVASLPCSSSNPAATPLRTSVPFLVGCRQATHGAHLQRTHRALEGTLRRQLADLVENQLEQRNGRHQIGECQRNAACDRATTDSPQHFQ